MDSLSFDSEATHSDIMPAESPRSSISGSPTKKRKTDGGPSRVRSGEAVGQKDEQGRSTENARRADDHTREAVERCATGQQNLQEPRGGHIEYADVSEEDGKEEEEEEGDDDDDEAEADEGSEMHEMEESIMEEDSSEDKMTAAGKRVEMLNKIASDDAAKPLPEETSHRRTFNEQMRNKIENAVAKARVGTFSFG
ncbi:unnamed protein product [Amoebophrya sp. A25]|nr:unnamed protein product [Amoebophrya sp. A25]|eukprot:GSA25T00018727001.1